MCGSNNCTPSDDSCTAFLFIDLTKPFFCLYTVEIHYLATFPILSLSFSPVFNLNRWGWWGVGAFFQFTLQAVSWFTRLRRQFLWFLLTSTL
jgi:hypothetical protein